MILRGYAAALCAVVINTSGAFGQANSMPADLYTPFSGGEVRSAIVKSSLGAFKASGLSNALTVVTVHLDAFRTNRLRLAIPGGGNVVFTRTNADDVGTWQGRANNFATATFVNRNGELTGSINSDQGLFKLVPVGATYHVLIKQDVDRMPPDDPPILEAGERPANEQGDAKVDSDEVAIIDVLVSFTPKALRADPSIESTIHLAVAEANQSYANTNVTIRLRLLETMRVELNEDGLDYPDIIQAFKTNTTVTSRRDLIGADIAVLIVDQPAYCGYAAAILADASKAFAAVHYRCATGYYSFAHELAHLFGARHNPEMDPTSTPYAYGHGRMNNPKWRTIMSYDCPAKCRRIQWWASPDVLYEQVPLGTADISHDARVLNDNRFFIAGFRPTLTPLLTND